MNCDFHIHTVLCGHAEPAMTVTNIIARAEAIGLGQIAITEHVGSREDMERIRIIREQVNAYRGPVHVIIGAEVDADRHYWDGRLVINSRDGIDYLIGTIHFMPGTDVMPHCHKERPLSQEQTFERWQGCLLGLAANPDLDTIAHPGIMIANALDLKVFDGKIMEVFEQAARISAEHNVAWELNNLSAKKLTPTQQASYPAVFRIAKQAEVRLVYGSDAHCLADIGSSAFVCRIMKQIGVSPEILYKPTRKRKTK